MFEFYGRLTRAEFVSASAIEIGLFAASVVGFPFLLVALSQAERLSEHRRGVRKSWNFSALPPSSRWHSCCSFFRLPEFPYGASAI